MPYTLWNIIIIIYEAHLRVPGAGTIVDFSYI